MSKYYCTCKKTLNIVAKRFFRQEELAATAAREFSKK